MRRLGTAMAITLATCLIATACSGDDDGDGDGGVGGIEVGDWSVEAALRELPPAASDVPRSVRTADLERAAELGDVDPPTDDEPAWFQGMVEDPIYVPFPASVVEFMVPPEEMKDAVGFDIFETGSFATLDVLGGSNGAIEVFTPAEAGSADSIADQVGSFDLRVADDRAALATDTAMLDDWEGADGSLADDEALDSIARALDGHDVYAAMINGYAEDTLPYAAIGIGQAVEDGEAVEYVAYVVDDADEAAPEIEKLWRGDGPEGSMVAEEVRVEDVTTEADDVVVVTLDPLRDPYPAFRMLEAGAGPFQL